MNIEKTLLMLYQKIQNLLNQDIIFIKKLYIITNILPS